MCITFLYCNPGDSTVKYKLILINNRDEDYARETQKATLTVKEDLQTIYGVDLAGVVKGTWLGVSARNGTIRLGNLANVTGEHIYGKLGRGPIVTNFIRSTESIEIDNQKIFDLSQDFGNFNFLSVVINPSGDIETHYVSNTPKLTEKLSPGYIGMSNSPLSHPFKKVEEGTELFKDFVKSHSNSTKEEFIDQLMELLKNDRKYLPDEELQRRRHESAPYFASIHVRTPEMDYGSRTRTIIIVDDAGVDYVEETMTTVDPDGAWERTHIKLPVISQL